MTAAQRKDKQVGGARGYGGVEQRARLAVRGGERKEKEERRRRREKEKEKKKKKMEKKRRERKRERDAAGFAAASVGSDLHAERGKGEHKDED